MDSESENESSPVKKIPATPEKPLIVDNATKDRRLHNMVGMFPDISALVIYWSFLFEFVLSSFYFTALSFRL